MSDPTEQLRLFDANCMLGPVIAPGDGFPRTADELLALMDRYDVVEALVYTSHAKEYHPADGNRWLLDEIAGAERLHPTWVLLPSSTGELPEGLRLVREMLTRGVRAARVFPAAGHHNFSMRRWCSGNLLDAIAAACVPLFVDLDQLDGEAIHDLLAGYPTMPLVLTNVGYRSDRLLYPLLEKFDNLYLETSFYFGHGAISAVAERFGPQRLLFGTGLPYRTPASAIGMLSYAPITPDARRQIAGDNLRRLLREVGP